MRKLAMSAMACMALFAVPALAEVYKWVDDSGKVNYGDKPPAGGKAARPLDEDLGTLSLVPGIPKEELERLHARYEQQRWQQLQREVGELLAREQAQAYAWPEAVYVESYVPAYGYQWPWRRFRGAGNISRWPDHPFEGHKPSTRAQSLLVEPRSSTAK